VGIWEQQVLRKKEDKNEEVICIKQHRMIYTNSMEQTSS
jgi:hypothetical protein